MDRHRHNDLVRIDLRNSPNWRLAPGIRRLDLLPLTLPSAALVHSVHLEGCSPPAPPPEEGDDPPGGSPG